MPRIMLLPMFNVSYFYSSTSQSMCAVYVTVLCNYMMYLLGMLLRYFLNDFEIIAVSPLITGITFVLFIIIKTIIIIIIFCLYAGYLQLYI